MDLKRKVAGMLIRLATPLYPVFNRNVCLFRHILIQTNTLCTRKCPWCYYGITDNVVPDTMPEVLFRKIIDNLSDLNYKGRVSLFETNEFLTDKRIFDFLQYASSRLSKAWFFLNTNGDLLNKNVIEKLFSAGLDELDVSSYDGKAFKKNKILLSGIRGKRIRHFDKRKTWFVTSNRGGSITSPFPKRKILNAFCDRVNVMMYIKPSGKVVSCFEDFFSCNVMGDVNYESLEEVWFGEKFNEFRESLNKGIRSENELCRRCNYIGFGGYYKIPKIAYLKKRRQK